jgi:hypothetical protein
MEQTLNAGRKEGGVGGKERKKRRKGRKGRKEGRKKGRKEDICYPNYAELSKLEKYFPQGLSSRTNGKSQEERSLSLLMSLFPLPPPTSTPLGICQPGPPVAVIVLFSAMPSEFVGTGNLN